MKNPNAQALGRLGGKASPRRNAWNSLTPEERAANSSAASAKRWGKLDADARKAVLAKVREGRKR